MRRMVAKKKVLDDFFLNDFTGSETEFIRELLSEAKKAFGRDKVFLSDVSITMIVDDNQDEQGQQQSSDSPSSVALLLRLLYPDEHYFVVRADRQKLLDLAHKIQQNLDPAN